MCDTWCVLSFGVVLCLFVRDWDVGVGVCVERSVLTVARYSVALFAHILEELMNWLSDGFASWCCGFMKR